MLMSEVVLCLMSVLILVVRWFLVGMVVFEIVLCLGSVFLVVSMFCMSSVQLWVGNVVFQFSCMCGNMVLSLCCMCDLVFVRWVCSVMSLILLCRFFDRCMVMGVVMFFVGEFVLGLVNCCVFGLSISRLSGGVCWCWCMWRKVVVVVLMVNSRNDYFGNFGISRNVSSMLLVISMLCGWVVICELIC